MEEHTTTVSYLGSSWMNLQLSFSSGGRTALQIQYFGLSLVIDGVLVPTYIMMLCLG